MSLINYAGVIPKTRCRSQWTTPRIHPMYEITKLFV